MRLTQFINEDLIDLDFDVPRDPDEEAELPESRVIARCREAVLGRIADLLENSGKIGNRSKLYATVLAKHLAENVQVTAG